MEHQIIIDEKTYRMIPHTYGGWTAIGIDRPERFLSLSAAENYFRDGIVTEDVIFSREWREWLAS